MFNFDWAADLSTSAARGIFLILYLMILITVWWIRDEYVLRSVSQPRPWHNLKWWTTGVLILLVAIYLYF